MNDLCVAEHDFQQYAALFDVLDNYGVEVDVIQIISMEPFYVSS